MVLPPTVRHRTHRETFWVLEAQLISPTSQIGKPLTEQEERVLDELKGMSSNAPVKKSTTPKIVPNPKFTKDWGKTDSVFDGYCNHSDSPVRFKGRRTDGHLAMYKYENHTPHDSTPKRGLKDASRALTATAVGGNMRSDTVFYDIVAKPGHEKKRYLSSVDTDGSDNTQAKLRKKVQNSMCYHRKKVKAEGALGGEHDVATSSI
jgi:hypothetical protein